MSMVVVEVGGGGVCGLTMTPVFVDSAQEFVRSGGVEMRSDTEPLRK